MSQYSKVMKFITKLDKEKNKKVFKTKWPTFVKDKKAYNVVLQKTITSEKKKEKEKEDTG